MSKREGSALTGLSVVFSKELQDFTRSARMVVLTILILLSAGTSIYVATKTMKNYVNEDSFLLLSLFTSSKNPIPSFLSLMSFLVPLTGIALGFDAINKEFQDRTLGRILSHPIYRDVLLFGKALGALVSMALVLLALWLFFLIFWPIISQLLAYAIGGGNQLTVAKSFSVLSRFSPYMLYTQASVAILNPTTRSLGVVLFYQMEGALGGTALPFGQSLLLIWPQLTSFVAAIILVFTFGYIKFQRMEIRM